MCVCVCVCARCVRCVIITSVNSVARGSEFLSLRLFSRLKSENTSHTHTPPRVISSSALNADSSNDNSDRKEALRGGRKSLPRVDNKHGCTTRPIVKGRAPSAVVHIYVDRAAIRNHGRSKSKYNFGIYSTFYTYTGGVTL